MKIYYMDENREKRNTAGAKAPDDIAMLCKKAGYQRIEMPSFPKEKKRLYVIIWLLFVCTYHWKRIMKTVEEGGIVIYQHPSYGRRIAERMIPKIQKKKNVRFVAVIHDLESLRGGIEGVIKKNEKTDEIGDNILLKHFDAVICHNEHMRQYMIGQGFHADKLVNLEIFDYLGGSDRIQPPKNVVPSIAVAGNLARGKCGYIYEIVDREHKRNESLIVNLYGNNFEMSEATENINYHGSFKPEELCEHLEGDFGLVWDGCSFETCAGNTGEYLKYNNPHKTSLYLSSNMPVIVWKQAAIADFVLKNGVGIAIDSLSELEERIMEITEEEYKEICRNVTVISHNLKQGRYFYTALETCLRILESN